MIPRTRSQVDLTGHGSSHHHYSQYNKSSGLSEMKDWRAAISTPLTYRIGNSTLHFRAHQVLAYSVIGCSILFLFYIVLTGGDTRTSEYGIYNSDDSAQCPNSTYPGYKVTSRTGTKYRIAVIADLDTDSKIGDDKWASFMLSGDLELSTDHSQVKIRWDQLETQLTSSTSAGGRGMELSELSVFNGRMLSLDDRTGIVYSILENRVVPWVILADGDGTSSKGFKAEWSTVKGDKLIVGGLGKEWTTQTGDILNHDPMWIKEVSCDGAVAHVNWRDVYTRVRSAVGITWPGYMIHEAVCWSQLRRNWVFLPRRMSPDKYDDVKDERMGTNTMILSDENFNDIRVIQVGERIPTHGFSSCKFIPGTNDELIVATKSEEIEGTVASYVMVFNIHGEVIMQEEKIGDRKFEGIEFL